MEIALTITIAAVVVAVALALIGRKLSRKDTLFAALAPLVGLLLLVWIPRDWRDTSLSVLVFVFGLASAGFWSGIILGALCYGMGQIIPGGNSVLLLVLLALALVAVFHDSISHLQRMKRAGELEPGKIASKEVALGGIVESVARQKTAAPEANAAAWKVKFNSEERASKSTLLIKGASFNAIFECDGAQLDLTQNYRQVKGEELRSMVTSYQLKTEEPLKEDDYGELWWLPEGAEAYVMGVPLWESRPEASDQYRGDLMLPVFRSQEGSVVYLADRSQNEVRLGALWDMWLYSGWGLVCAAIAVTQIFFE